jgi:RHS repeat-associated protein
LPAGKESRYAYATDGNRDRLVSYDGEICKYDGLGNPIVYRNKGLEWSHLGNLAKYDGTAFAYDASGMRISKTRNGNKTKFHWAGDKLIAERRTRAFDDLELAEPADHLAGCAAGCDNECETHKAFPNASVVDIEYIRGADGLTGFVISRKDTLDKTYYYRKNSRGDITHITDDDGIVKAEYVYDAWGNHNIVKNEENIGSINPYRYRGYYFDAETNLYYLKSRYYDPETGRFISADAIGILDTTKEHINGLNLYAYCLNNLVSMFDENGRFFKKIFGKIIAPVVAFTLGVAATFNNAINTIGNWINDMPDWVKITIGVTILAGLAIATVLTLGAAAPITGLAATMVVGAFIGATTSARCWGRGSDGRGCSRRTHVGCDNGRYRGRGIGRSRYSSIRWRKNINRWCKISNCGTSDRRQHAHLWRSNRDKRSGHKQFLLG